MVLLIDTDPQGHASLSLGISRKNIKGDLFAFLVDNANSLDVIQDTYISRLKIIPSSKRLVDFERNYSRVREARVFLARRLAEVEEHFDYIIFDTPPNLSLLSFSALIAAREVFIPVQAHFLGMKGVFDMMRLLYRIRNLYNKDLELKGIILTFYNDKMRLSKAVVAEIKKTLGDNVFLHPVRNNISLAEAPMFGRSIFQYNGKCQGAVDYLKIANQIEKM